MARWKLTDKHYLHTDPPTEWEQKEVDLETGEELRKRYEVPRMLDPDRRNRSGVLIEQFVCLKGKGQPGDVTIKGPPTASMEPLDEEAERLSAAVAQGRHPINSLPTTMDAAPPDLLRQMQAQINALMIANDELHKRVAASEGEALQDLEALNAQRVPIVDPKATPAQRRV